MYSREKLLSEFCSEIKMSLVMLQDLCRVLLGCTDSRCDVGLVYDCSCCALVRWKKNQ